ncbi:MAG: lipoate--protein ligase family protein [Anaerolineales bacterium]|nr:lipoate--protein ligase family protein [Anaerolineales bacterium]
MTEAPAKWRILRTQPAVGAWNMAVDESILESTAQGLMPPTLRLYAWSPACLSLGYAQSADDVDFEKLNHFGWDIVRRPTGGRAILHTNELTYSICGMNSNPLLTGSVLESYKRLSQGLLEALHQIGINADVPRLSADQRHPGIQNPVCFEVPSNYEITVGEKKLIGSAQARRKSGVLQHGSLPLSGDLTRIIDVLHYPDETSRNQARQGLLDHATTLEGVLGYPGDWWLISYAFQDAFQRILNIDLQSLPLSPAEGSRAIQLFNEKYAHPDWTNKR